MPRLSKEEVAKLTLELPNEDRLDLAHTLLASVPALDNEVEWAAETERRLNEVRTGAVKPVDFDESLARLEEKFGRR